MCTLMVLPGTASGAAALDAKYTSLYERCHALAAELARAPSFSAQSLGAPASAPLPDVAAN